MKCLKCNLELQSENEKLWHKKCIRDFFGTNELPTIDVNFDEIEETLVSIKEKQDITGVQKKLSLHLIKNDKNARLTLVNKPAGYILKFESKSSKMAIDEFVTMTLAKIFEIKTVPFGLIKLSNGKYAYITKRIDRVESLKIHMEDFCQLSNKITEQKYQGSYEYCGKILKQYSNLSMHGSFGELIDFFKIVIFSYLVGNSDMHLKNFSLIEDKTIYFAPAYDLINVHILINDEEDLALNLNGKRKNITKNDIVEFGHNLGLPDKIISKILMNFCEKKDKAILCVQQSLLSTQDKEKYITELKNKLKLFEK